MRLLFGTRLIDANAGRRQVGVSNDIGVVPPARSVSRILSRCRRGDQGQPLGFALSTVRADDALSVVAQLRVNQATFSATDIQIPGTTWLAPLTPAPHEDADVAASGGAVAFPYRRVESRRHDTCAV